MFVPLDEASVLAAIERARALGGGGGRGLPALVDRQPGARAARRRADRERLPGLPYTLSHQLNPIIREYRRASSTAIDASLKPLMQELPARRWSATCARPASPATSSSPRRSAARWRPEQVVERPIYSVGSGPSMAPVAALDVRAGGGRPDGSGSRPDRLRHGRHDLRRRPRLRRARSRTTAETWLGGRWIGHITGIRSVDVKSIGAGGGSIVWIDPGGLLRVGPRSAGADPGPACYGRGGTEPTVTDAAVVLGWIDPDYFLGGRLPLDADAARTRRSRKRSPHRSEWASRRRPTRR